jgi:hypothetical protein
MDRPKISAAAAAVAAMALTAVIAPRIAHAQLRAMGLPIPTTLVITKPAPGQIFGNQQVVTLGVGTKQYKFVLTDAYVDSTNPNIQWPDVWQLVSQSNPNFVVQGQGADTFEKIKPGQQLTIKAMFAPLNRTLEVMNVMPGKGALEPSTHY